MCIRDSYTAAQMVLKGLDGFKEDFMEHILHNRCCSNLDQPVPCVALCPAGVDIPGYIALTGEGRYADAVRLIRKDNPFPTACALVCEHPCESRCRRNMLDNSINIRGIKRVAVDMAGYVPAPACPASTGKRIAIIGGGPSGLSAAYYPVSYTHLDVYKRQPLYHPHHSKCEVHQDTLLPILTKSSNNHLLLRESNLQPFFWQIPLEAVPQKSFLLPPH